MKGLFKFLLFTAVLFTCTNLHAQDDKVYDVVEVMPQFPGGDSAMLVFIKQNLRYVNHNVQGKVYIKFVINETGYVEQVKVAKSLDPALDSAAVIVVEKLPRWQPGTMQGKAVKVSYVIPIAFKLIEPAKAQATTPKMLLEKETKEIFAMLKEGNAREAKKRADSLVEQYPDLIQAYAIRVSVNFKLLDYYAACNDLNKAKQLGDVSAQQLIDKYCKNNVVYVDPDSMKAWTARRLKLEADTLKALQVLEVMPEFPGGQQAFMKYLASHIVYPPIAKENDIEDTVYVMFVVDSGGNVVNPMIMRAIDEHLDKEAFRVVKFMPKWKPGTQNSKPVDVHYTVPIRFKLQ